jgi:hypothetical protein
MREFVDLKGASGAAYRFRVWPESDHHTPTAGNFAVLVLSGSDVTIVALGVSSDLSRIKPAAQDAIASSSGRLFTRLNVSRSARDAEHDDLLAGHPAAKPLLHEV